MEPDCYVVEVIHYLNPHLIWVRNRSNNTMEQIGVYGVIPLDKELVLDTQEIETRRSNTWMPAATYVMMKVFMEATAVWFEPTYIHRRTSIFDTNIHKYGELLIEKSDGRKRKLSSYLRKSETALYDDAAFHQQLSLGLIQTKLSKTETDEVMKVITSKLNDDESIVSLNKQTEVYQAAKKLEALTTENLNKHNSRLNKNITNKDILNVLDRKFKDLQLCKDLEDEPLSRATKMIKTTSDSNSNSRLQKLKRLSAKYNVANHDDSNDVKPENNSTYNDSDPIASYSQNSRSCEINIAKSRMAALPDESSATREDESSESFQPRKNLKNKKNKSPKNKPPEYDVKTHMRVAYSPPGVDKSKLALKIVPINREGDATETCQVHKEDDSNVMNLKDDMFGEVDSGVNINITNKDVLKKYIDINISKPEDATKDRNCVGYNHCNKKESQITERNKENHVKCTDTNNREHKNVTKQDRNLSKESQYIEAKDTSDISSSDGSALTSHVLQRKMRLHAMKMNNVSSSSSNTTSSSDKVKNNESSSSNTKTASKDSDDDEVNELIEKYTANLKADAEIAEKKHHRTVDLVTKKNNVNPFQNFDPNLSVFVDKLVKPVLMQHSKNNSRIEPVFAIDEIPFNTHVHNVLRNMNIDRAMTIQSVSWMSILRGLSTFLIGPQACGKTMGYIPAICRLISDFDNDIVNSVGPTCIIMAATAQSVSDIEYKCRMLLGTKETIFCCYAGMDLLKVTTSLLNGCNLFICTPCVLVRLLLQTDFGLDLRRLTTFVLDDCERLEEVYKSEVKIALSKIKHMLKARVNKEVKVQYILSSRIWCDFMEPLAKKAPNTVIYIGAFQECVLYSKANTTVDFVKPENKVAKILEFLEKIDIKKKTIVVCRTDEEVVDLEKILKEKHKVVYACNNEMTIEDLRNFNKTWDNYADPTIGPILVCCDGNLSHMNITDAHYLVHYSMPELFSRFCKRFSVLNDNYPSIFKEHNESVAIRIILEESNAEQLPKICNFIKRCTKDFPKDLDVICKAILTRKDIAKAASLVPICGNLLALGDCPDFWYCRERHTSSQDHDQPKEWMPTDGVITFRILHYQNAVTYSARLLSNINKGGTKKYPQTYSTLSFKMGTYFSQDNKQLLGVPKVGDICAVSINQNFFVRCQVVDIINKYRNGLPNHVLVKLIDEEKLETTRDIYLYHLPKEFREVETYVAQISLAGVLPKDKDITFSELAKNHIKKDLEKNETLYMRGKVVLTIGNRIFVDNIDVCQDLTSMNEVVVKNNFKEMLASHTEAFPDHIDKVKSRLFPDEEVIPENTDFEQVEEIKPVKEPPKVQWAHLNREDLSLVYFTSAIDPSTFFVRLVKFADTMEALCKDIKKYTEGISEPLSDVKEKDIVLAKFPDNKCYERARVDVIKNNRAKCFFVDYGDWREVPLKHLIEIPEKFVHRLPFQAIECRLLGVEPVGDAWTDFSTNWLCDRCDVEDEEDLKGLYVQYYLTDKAKFTGGKKYAVALIDTNNDSGDVLYNTQMIDLNLAAPDENEIEFLNKMKFTRPEEKGNKSNDEEDWTNDTFDKSVKLTNQPLRSMPLIEDSDTESDRWSFNLPDDFVGSFKPDAKSLKLPHLKSETSSIASSKQLDNDSATSEFEVVKKLQIKELDSDDLSTSESASSAVQSQIIQEANEGRKPKLLWKQNKATVTIKIMLVGAENYELNIKDRDVHFSANIYDTIYDFKLNLYGIVDKNKSTHAYKGQYILVKLFKVMQKTWLTLTKESFVAKWIVYDHDSIETSSEEEDALDDSMVKVIKKNYHEEDSDSDSFCDDVNYNYPS